MARLRVLVLFAVALLACGPAPDPRPPPVPVGDACERSQQVLDHYECPERASAKGTRWVDACHRLAEQGYPPPAECIADARSCAAARECR